MREDEEVQKMGHIVQRLVRNAIMQAVNQVIQKKTQQEAAKFGNEWKGSFHCLVSGYYSGMTVKYLMLPFAVFCILCAIGSGIAGGLTYSIWFLVIAVVCLVTRSYGMKMMRVIIYWDNGMAFYDKDGNELVQLPRTAIEQMTVKNGKITIHGKVKSIRLSETHSITKKKYGKCLIFIRQKIPNGLPVNKRQISDRK